MSYEAYERRQFKNISPILRSLARHCTVCLKYPIFRILRSIARRFMLNEIEAMFMVYLVRETEWGVHDAIITENAEEVRSVVSFVKDQPQHHQLILYLLLITFSIKECLNQDNPFLPTALKICPRFQAIFELWSQRYAECIRHINPRTINQLYQLCSGRWAEEEQDYVAMVDEIIKLSPAYSFTRCAEERLRAEQVEQDDNIQEFWRAQPEKRLKKEFHIQPQLYASFSQGGLAQIAEAGHTNDDSQFFLLQERIDELGFEHSRAVIHRASIEPDLVSHSQEQFYEQSSLPESKRGEQIRFRRYEVDEMNRQEIDWDGDDFLEFINNE